MDKKKAIVCFIVAPLVCILIIGMYGVGFAMTVDKFTYNTNINGYNVSLKSYDEAYDIITNNIKDYSITIKSRGNDDLIITGDDISLEVDFNGKLKDTYDNQDRLMWIIDVFNGQTINIEENLKFDKNKLDAIFDKAGCLNSKSMTESKNAYISKNLVDGKFVIIPEVYGTKLDTEKAQEKIIDAIMSRKEIIDIEAEGLYTNPEIKSDDKGLNDKLNEMNNLINIEINYNVNGKTFIFNSDYISNYLMEDENGCYISDKCTSDFVNKMNSELTTMGITRKFTTTLGKEIDVAGGNWGWWLNIPETKAKLDEMLAAGKSGNGEVVWRQEAPFYGDKEYVNYVEIDMTNQHLYLYTNNELVGDWDVVTGTYTSKSRRTPAGTYILNYKTRNAVLRGPGYASPVSYWMPFNGGIGIHDASWRSSFGGTIYMYNGSHGCINMPKSGAKAVYDAIDKTYAIICYYL